MKSVAAMKTESKGPEWVVVAQFEIDPPKCIMTPTAPQEINDRCTVGDDEPP